MFIQKMVKNAFFFEFHHSNQVKLRIINLEYPQWHKKTPSTAVNGVSIMFNS